MASDLVNSVRRSSSGVPMVRSLVFRMATRSQSRSASSSRWVVRKTVTPRLRSPLTSSSTSCAATGSSPDVGSSRNITSGSLSSERASEARCLSPLDSDPHRSSARSARPTADSASKIRACRPGSPYSRAKKSRFSATVSRVVQARRLRRDRDALPYLRLARRAERNAGHRGGPGRRRDQRAEHPHRRGLARPVRPEEPEHLALADAERHVIDGAPAAEDLAQVADLDRGRTAHRRPLPRVICSMSYRTDPTRYRVPTTMELGGKALM